MACELVVYMHAVYLIVCLIGQPQPKQFHVSAQIHVHTNWPIESKRNHNYNNSDPDQCPPLSRKLAAIVTA